MTTNDPEPGPPRLQLTFEHLDSAARLKPAHRDQCYRLVRRLRGLYVGSGMGWNASGKRREMAMAGMNYELAIDSSGRIAGFASYTPVDELDDGTPCAFLYELHVRTPSRGLGQTLLDRVRASAPSGRVALTVFCANDAAARFYARNGFVQVGDVVYAEDQPRRRASGWRTLLWERGARSQD